VNTGYRKILTRDLINNKYIVYIIHIIIFHIIIYIIILFFILFHIISHIFDIKISV